MLIFSAAVPSYVCSRDTGVMLANGGHIAWGNGHADMGIYVTKNYLMVAHHLNLCSRQLLLGTIIC